MIWSLIPDWLVAAAAAGLTGFVALLVGRWTGKREGKAVERAEADRREAQGYAETRKRADETDLGDDPAVLREWLRNRDPRKP